MRLALLLEDDRAEFLRMQQELVELLPDDVDVSISKFKQSYKLTCKLEGFNSMYHIKDVTAITKSFCNFIIASLLKPKLVAVGFKAPRGSQSQYYMQTPDGREYTGVLLKVVSGLTVPFRIIARHKDIAKTSIGGFPAFGSIYAIADIHSAAGLDRALVYLGSLKYNHTEETHVFE